MKKSLVAALLFFAVSAAPLLADPPSIRVEPLDRSPIDPSTLLLSPHHDHYAAVSPSNYGASVIVDGRSSRKYDEIVAAGPARKPYMIFNSTGEHFAFLARRNRALIFVIDGQEQPLPDNVAITAAHFSRDGSQFVLAFAAPGQSTQILLNGKSLGQFQSASTPRFSANSRHLGFIATTPNGPAAFIDGRPGPIFQNVTNLEFSPDGEHFAYIGTGAFPGDNLQHLVVDGWKLAAFDHITNVKFSIPGDHILFTADSAGAAYGPPQSIVGYDDIRWPAQPPANKPLNPQLSPDGSRVAYIEASPRDPRLSVLTINGARGTREFADITNLAFTPDGAHLTYSAADPRGLSVYIDDNPTDPVTSLLTPPVFSADSRHFMFIATKSLAPAPRPGDRYDLRPRQADNAPVLVIDNRTYPVPRLRDEAAPAQLQFSPDAQHIAYTLGPTVIIDGDPVRISDRPDPIADLHFSLDSQHLFFTTADPANPGQNLLVIDSQPIPGFSLITAPQMLPDNSLSVFAFDQRGGNPVRLSIALPPFNYYGVRPPVANQPVPPPPPDNRSRGEKRIDKAVDTVNKLHDLFNH